MAGANIIKLLRVLNGLTPTKLSEKTGIPRFVLYEYEQGWRPIPAKDAVKLSAAFGIPLVVDEETPANEPQSNGGNDGK
ncbi:MAG: helix-turn-helix protein [Syntrophorhabdus sp. PtaB.Bin027]|jgi:predicted transcriptional regulator|nr:MAG: helix-turn-helix protein [Syntrophorhabdus sp. PtaB.Bin027]